MCCSMSFANSDAFGWWSSTFSTPLSFYFPSGTLMICTWGLLLPFHRSQRLSSFFLLSLFPNVLYRLCNFPCSVWQVPSFFYPSVLFLSPSIKFLNFFCLFCFLVLKCPSESSFYFLFVCWNFPFLMRFFSCFICFNCTHKSSLKYFYSCF